MSNQNLDYLESSISLESKDKNIPQKQWATLEKVESEVWQGIRLEQENKLDEAVEHYRQAVALNSQSAVAHHILAIALKKQNNLIEADYYHRLAVSLGQNHHPEPQETILEKSKRQISLQYSNSSSNLTKLQIDHTPKNNLAKRTASNSAVVLPKLTAVAPGTYVENNQLEITKIYLQQAKLYYADGRWQKSIDACEEALNICPDLPETYKIYGNSLQQMGKAPEAMGYYAKALAKDPHLAEVYANIGSLHARKNSWHEAISYYQKALAIDPQEAKIYLHLSKAWERIGADDNALQALLEALKVQPEIIDASQYIQLVDDLLAENKAELAISCCEQGIRIQPPQKSLYLKLIDILESNGQVEKAVRLRHLVANLADNNSSATFRKGRIQALLSSTGTNKSLPPKSPAKKITKALAQQGQSQNSQKLLTKKTREENITVEQYLAALKEKPNSSVIRLNLANLLARKQRWQEAINYYQQAIKIEPNLAIAYIRLGKIYGILGKQLESAELIYRGYSIQPEMGTAEQHYQLGEFWLGQYKGKVAISCYRRAIELKPGFTAAYDRLKQLIALQGKQAEKPKVEGQMKKTALLSPESVVTEKQYHQQAIEAIRAENWQQGAHYYQQAIKINPQNLGYYFSLGKILIQLEQWQEAVACYQTAAELEPENPDIHHNLGEIFLNQASWEKAVTAYEKAIALGSQNSWTYHNLGHVLLQLEQWQQAAEYFTQAISLKADFVWSHYNLGEALSELEQWDQALGAYQAAQQIAPDLPEARVKIGRILYRRSQQSQEQALSFAQNQLQEDPDNIELYHQAIALDKKNPELYLGLGKALAKQGQTEEAALVYRIGLEIEPQNLELLQRFNELAAEVSHSTGNADTLSREVQSPDHDLLRLPQHPAPVVSIIIPVCNQIDYTSKCLRSIAEQTAEDGKIEVIVVNDCSTDNTVEILNQVQGLKRIDNQKSLGLFESYKLGVHEASGEYIYFLNNHTELRPKALENLLSILEKHPEVGAVGSKIISSDGNLVAAGGIVWQNATVEHYGVQENAAAPQYNYLRSVDYCSGTSLLIKRRVFAALGNLSSNFTSSYYQDVDLCFAIRHQLGLKVIYQPQSEVIDFREIACHQELDSSTQSDRYNFAHKWSRALADYDDGCSQNRIVTASRRLSGTKTILVADLGVPCFDKDSEALRIWELLEIFKQLNYHVIFLTDKGVQEQPYVEMLQQKSIEVIYQESGYELGLEQQLEKLLPIVDIAWICHPQLWEKYAPLIRQHPQIKSVYDTVSLNYLKLQRSAEFDNQGMQNMRQWVRMQVRELQASHEADLTITVSALEKQILEQQQVQNLAIVPNIHRVSSEEQPGFDQREGLLFIGNYDLPHNLDGVNWLVTEIMPVVWQTLPNLTLTLLGNNPEAAVVDFNQDLRIKVTGYVPDVAPYFSHHRVFVAPLRYGAGVTGKVLHSLAYSLPIVSTEYAIAGMELINQQHFLEANQTQEFANQIIKLYSDAELWQKLADNSKEAISSFRPRQVQTKVAQILNSLITAEQSVDIHSP